MGKAILEQIDESGNSKVEFSELKKSLEKGGVLFDIEEDIEKQEDLKKELESIDTDIEKTFLQLIFTQQEIINKKKEENRKDWERGLLIFYSKNKDNIDEYNKSLKKSENIDAMKYEGKSTWQIIESTTLGQKEEMTEVLSNKLDATWYTFIDSYFDSNDTFITPEVKSKLAVGSSFAFMKRYNENKPEENVEKMQKKGFLGKSNGFLDKIGKYSGILTGSFSGGGLDMLGGLVGGLGQFSADLPLDSFFKKIQNSVNIIKKNKNSVNKITNPASFVSFFDGVEDTKFLDNKEISNKYIESLQINSANLTEIANTNGRKFDKKTLELLKSVINKAGPVLTMKKTGRSTILGIYDQLQGVFSQIGGIAKTLGFDFGSVKEFLKGLGPIGDMAFAVLGFNGVDGFVQEYWLDKLGGGLDDKQQNFVNYSVAYYKDNFNDSEYITKFKRSDGTETTDKNEMDLVQTFKQSDSFFSKIGGKFKETGKGDDKSVVPTISLGLEVDGSFVDISDKIPLSYNLVRDSIQKSLDENYEGEGLTVDDNVISEISKKILSDQEFLYEFSTNDDLGQADFVAALCGSYIIAEHAKNAKNADPMGYAKAIAVGALSYDNMIIKKDEEDENSEKTKKKEENVEDVEKTSKKEFLELKIDQQSYIKRTKNNILSYDYVDDVPYSGETKKPNDADIKNNIESLGKNGKPTFEQISAKIFEEAGKYTETKNIVPYIFAQIEQESRRNLDAHNTTGENSYGLMQINKEAHPDYDENGNREYNIEYGMMFLADKIKQKGSIKYGFDKYNGNQAGKEKTYSESLFERYERRYLPEYFGSNNIEQLKGQKLKNMGMLGNSHIGGLNYGSMFSKTYAQQGVEKNDGNYGEEVLRKNGGKITDLYIDGDMSKGLKDGVKEHINSKPAIKSVLLFFGGNEASSGSLGTDYKSELKKLIESIKEINPDVKPILVCSPLDKTNDKYDDRKENNEVIRKLAEDNNYPLFDFENQFPEGDFEDKVHLKPDGYKKMVKMIESSFVS